MWRQSSDSRDEVSLPKSRPAPIFLAPGIAGLAGMASIPFFLALKRPASSSLRVAAHALPVSVGSAVALDHIDRKNTHRGMRTLDSHVISNGTRVLGASAGLLLATCRRLPGLKARQRRIGAACVGAGVGELAMFSFHVVEDSKDVRSFQQQVIELKNDCQMSARSLFEFGCRGVSDVLLQKAPLGPSPAEPEQRMTRPDAMAMTLSEVDAAFPHVVDSPLAERSGPYHTMQGLGDTEPVPRPIINYDWMPSPDRVVPELTDLISKLRVRRAKLCAEGQVIWDWLSEKEAQFYELRDSDTAVGYDAEQNKIRARAYCRALADKHVMLWAEVSRIDWTIAHSLKHMEQHKQFQKGQYDTKKLSSSKTEADPINFALYRLREELSVLEKIVEEHTAVIEMLEKDLKSPKMTALPENMRKQLQSMSKQEREANLRRVIKEGEEARQPYAVYKAAVEEILKDGQKKGMHLTGEDR